MIRSLVLKTLRKDFSNGSVEDGENEGAQSGGCCDYTG